jgi:hypothetical protein
MVVYLLLLFIVLVNLAVRFPFTPHPLGSDTYQILLMADVITEHGAGSWQLSPLSYAGYYPYSYPTGYPALVSALAQMTGLAAELVIYLTSLALSIVACLGAFVLGHRYTSDPRAALACALIYSTIPVFIAMSNWQITARGPFLALLPFFLLALVARLGPWKKTLLVLLLLFTALALHRMSILLVPVILLHLLLRFRPVFARLTLKAFGFERRRWTVALVAVGAVGVGFAIPFLEDPPSPFDNHWWLSTEAGGALPDEVPGGGPALLSVYVAGRWGPALLFALLGLLLVAMREHKSTLDWMMIGMVVVLAPFLPVASYAYETLTLVAAVLAALFLVKLPGTRPARRRLRLVLGTFVIVGMLAFSAFTVAYRIGNYDPRINFRNYVTDDEYSTSLYFTHQADAMHVFNDPNAERKMTAIGRLPSEFDFIDTTTPITFSWSDFWSRFQDNPLLTLRDPFTGPDELALARDRLRLLQYQPDDPASKAIMERYGIEYLTVKRWNPEKYQPLVAGAARDRYQVYASADYRVYAL